MICRDRPTARIVRVSLAPPISYPLKNIFGSNSVEVAQIDMSSSMCYMNDIFLPIFLHC